MPVIEKYCEQEGLKLAKKIDRNIALVIKPHPWYCPNWLYRKIIRDSVVTIQVKGQQ